MPSDFLNNSLTTGEKKSIWAYGQSTPSGRLAPAAVASFDTSRFVHLS
jgi:hypothetical protein